MKPLWGASGLSSLTATPFHIHDIARFCHWKHGFSYVYDTQLHLSFQPDDPTVSARISACLSDISLCMKNYYLQLNPAKTELLVIPADPKIRHNLSIQLCSSTITPFRMARILGVVIDDQLDFKDHIARTIRTCRYIFYNIRKIKPFLSEHAMQLIWYTDMYYGRLTETSFIALLHCCHYVPLIGSIFYLLV